LDRILSLLENPHVPIDNTPFSMLRRLHVVVRFVRVILQRFVLVDPRRTIFTIH
jgi:hypothetical protein